MKQEFYNLQIHTNGQKLYEFTDQTMKWIKDNKFENGIIRFQFEQLCDQNLGAEDYLEIAKISKYIVIEKIPQFDDFNSNQQQRFITLIDVIYDKNIPLSVTANQSLDEFTSSKALEKTFKRTLSRLYELTSK